MAPFVEIHEDVRGCDAERIFKDLPSNVSLQQYVRCQRMTTDPGATDRRRRRNTRNAGFEICGRAIPVNNIFFELDNE